jgi:hypothetical protein
MNDQTTQKINGNNNLRMEQVYMGGLCITIFEAFNIQQKWPAVFVNQFDTASMTLEMLNTNVGHYV